jgi:hypothetical protein
LGLYNELNTYNKGQTMTTKTILTDQELIDAFSAGYHGAGKMFEATFIPVDAPRPSVSLWDNRYFRAKNKAEAVRIAREYGERIIDKKMLYVYLASNAVGQLPRSI